mmetsp:Transcript_100517/g.281650  ORF Transcript_100517/g.281650 Transcript_100517/m.281650 type:complete len:305 (+) Transcript_100517:750-1664(+)
MEPAAVDEDEAPVPRRRALVGELPRGLGVALCKVRAGDGQAGRAHLGHLCPERAGGVADLGVVYLHRDRRARLHPGPPRADVARERLGGLEGPLLGPQPRRHARARRHHLRRRRGGEVHLGHVLALVRRPEVRVLAAAPRGVLLGPAAGREADLRAQGPRGLRQRQEGRRVEAGQAPHFLRGVPGTQRQAVEPVDGRLEARRALRAQHHQRPQLGLRGLHRLELVPRRDGRPEPCREHVQRGGDLRQRGEEGALPAHFLVHRPLLEVHPAGREARRLQHEPGHLGGDGLPQRRWQVVCRRHEPE